MLVYGMIAFQFVWCVISHVMALLLFDTNCKQVNLAAFLAQCMKGEKWYEICCI